jgi:outer membrane protein OmpA-like peptidoglycan-associated protein
MKLRSALMIATFLAAPAVAMAQPVSGLYVGGGVGYTILTGTSAKVTQGTTSTGLGDLKSNGGFGSVLSLGYGYGNGFRTEIEGNFLSQQTRVNGGGLQGGGNVTNYGASVNGFYDFNVGLPVVPFVGLGVGYEWTKLNSYSLYSAGGTASATSVSTNAKGSVAGNAFIGASYDVPGAPGLAVTGEYRFSGTFSNEKFGTNVAGRQLKLNNQYDNSVLVGLRYAFGAAPAPAPMAPAPAPAPVAVAPAPAPARSYLVFFDWDKADLNARAQQIIAEAAQASTHVATTKIEVSGYADRTGTAAYNQALSLRRANNVAAELVRLGVPKTEISIAAYGDTRPLVPTAPNTREPQNRRVEIVLK